MKQCEIYHLIYAPLTFYLPLRTASYAGYDQFDIGKNVISTICVMRSWLEFVLFFVV